MFNSPDDPVPTTTKAIDVFVLLHWNLNYSLNKLVKIRIEFIPGFAAWLNPRKTKIRNSER